MKPGGKLFSLKSEHFNVKIRKLCRYDDVIISVLAVTDTAKDDKHLKIISVASTDP